MAGLPPPSGETKRSRSILFAVATGILFAVALIYIGVSIALYSMQTGLVYPGSTRVVTPESEAKELKMAGLIPWTQTTPGASGPQGFVRADFAQPAPRGTVVFFHGNGEVAWECASDMDGLRQRGFRVFFYEYPGYGIRPGLPSEATIVPDAEAVVGSLAKAGYGPIYLWGHSLGSGVAAEVASGKGLAVQGLILACPWDTLRNVAAQRYPYIAIHELMRDNYDSIAHLQNFGHPICILRGDQDDTIPPERTLNLYAHLAEPKKMMVMNGYGHGDWSFAGNETWWDEALDFIAPKAASQQPRTARVIAPTP